MEVWLQTGGIDTSKLTAIINLAKCCNIMPLALVTWHSNRKEVPSAVAVYAWLMSQQTKKAMSRFVTSPYPAPTTRQTWERLLSSPPSLYTCVHVLIIHHGASTAHFSSVLLLTWVFYAWYIVFLCFLLARTLRPMNHRRYSVDYGI